MPRDERRSLWVVVVAFAAFASLIAMSVSAEAGLSAGAGQAAVAAATTTAPKTTTTTTFPMNSTPVTYNVPASIVSDCSTDVTPKLLAWFKSLPDNSVLRFKAGACYQIENILLIEGRRKLTFDGNGATFQAKTDGASQTPPPGVSPTKWPRRRAHWWVKRSSDIVLTNMKIVGANPYVRRVDAQFNPNYEVQSGLVVDGSTRVTLGESTISKVWGDFVTLEGGSRDVTIRGNVMVTSGRQGVAITKASKVLIDGNILNDIRWGAFDLEPNAASTVLDDIRIVGNLTYHSRWVWFASWGVSTNVRNVVVERNTVLGTSLTLVFVRNLSPENGRRGPFTFAYNDFRLGAGEAAAFELMGAKQVSIHDNIVRTTSDTKRTMVRAWESDQLQVHHNDFTGAVKILDQGLTPTWCEYANKPAALSQNKPC